MTTIVQLTDDSRLIAQVGELRWREWAYDETSLEDWIRISARECGLTELPITLVALDDDRMVLGAVGLGDSDDALTTEEQRGRSPKLARRAIEPTAWIGAWPPHASSSSPELSARARPRRHTRSASCFRSGACRMP